MTEIADTPAGEAAVAANSIAHWFDFHRMLHTPGEWTAQVVQIGDEREPHLGRFLYLVHS